MRIKRILPIILSALMLLFLFGCSGEEAPSPTKEPPAEPVNEVFDDGGRAENPVHAIFTSFYAAYLRAVGGMSEAVSESGDIALIKPSVLILNDEAELAVIDATVGLLTPDEDSSGSFSGTLSGTYAGSGKLVNLNAFRYDFDNGDTLTGSITGGTRLDCVLTEGGRTLSICLMMKRGGFIFWLTEGEATDVCEITEGGLRFASLPNEVLTDDTETFPEASEYPVFEYGNGKAEYHQ